MRLGQFIHILSVLGNKSLPFSLSFLFFFASLFFLYACEKKFSTNKDSPLTYAEKTPSPWTSDSHQSLHESFHHVLVIFIENSAFQDLTCASALTSHPISGVKLLCEKGAQEIEYLMSYQKLNQAVRDWLSPYQRPFMPQLYYQKWSTQLFPSHPELLTHGNIEMGFETIQDSFSIKNGSWYTESSQMIQNLILYQNQNPVKESQYQVMTLRDLVSYKSSSSSSASPGSLSSPISSTPLTSLSSLRSSPLLSSWLKKESSPLERESIWESIDEALYSLFTSLNLSSHTKKIHIVLLGITDSEKETMGSGLILSSSFSKIKHDENSVKKTSLNSQNTESFLWTLEHLSTEFHKLWLPSLTILDPYKEHALLNQKQVENPLLSKTENITSQTLDELCSSPLHCGDVKPYLLWIRNLQNQKDVRRLAILKNSSEGFVLNEILQNPLKLNLEQRKAGFLILKAFSEE
jgi:hypothetical protein